MDIRRFTQVLGIIFLLIGVLGFFPGVVTHPGNMDPPNSGLLFGLFPVNAVHNLVHIGFGVWALAASKFLESSRNFCAATAVIYGLLTIFGFIPNLRTLFGLVPLHGHDIWLHGVIALSSAYYAWGWQGVRIRQP